MNGAAPLSSQEQQELNFLYEEWAHPFFISIQEFCRLMEVRGGDWRGKGGRGEGILYRCIGCEERCSVDT